MKNIEEYKKEDGFYSDDGCFYESAENLIQCDILKFCGCGDPQANLKFIKEALFLIDEKSPMKGDEFSKWYKIHHEKELKLFGNMQSAYFFWYWADKEEYTEHGGSVPGWLTEKGKLLLSNLKKLNLTTT